MYAAILIERRMVGAGLIALVLLGLAIIEHARSRLSSGGLRRRRENVASESLLVNAVALAPMLAAVGMHLLVFEDMTYELRMTNRRLESAREELLQAAITDPLTGATTAGSSSR